MKAFLKIQASRIDALSLRERGMMFLSLAVALTALVDMFVLSPAIAERKQLVAQARLQTQQLEALRSQWAASIADAPDDSAPGRLRAAVVSARAQQVALDAQIRDQLAGRDEIARLPEVLDRVLRRHERLTLTRLSAVPDAAAVPAAATAPTVRWQGADLSVAGNYADLVQYLADLEAALPGLRWGALQVATPSMPPVMTVRLLLAGEAP
jgi:MSHA biogenesis protein MshJ